MAQAEKLIYIGEVDVKAGRDCKKGEMVMLEDLLPKEERRNKFQVAVPINRETIFKIGVTKIAPAWGRNFTVCNAGEIVTLNLLLPHLGWVDHREVTEDIKAGEKLHIKLEY